MNRLSMLLAVVALTSAACTTPNPGDGEKVGTIVKLSHEGIICTTGEGQLIRGGMAGGSGAFGVVPFDFTVPAPLWAQAESAFDRQIEVKIHYHSAWSLACSSETGHYLTAVEPER